jgi:outer membrane biosynthesis protein TonB
LERRKEKKALIISFLLHVLLLLLFLFGAFKESALISFISPARKKRPQMARSALIPKRSDKGTKIFFDNSTILPSPPPTKQQAQAAQPKPQVAPKKKIIPKKKIEKAIAKTILEKPVDIKKEATKNVVKKDPPRKMAQQKQMTKKQSVAPRPQKPKTSLLSLTKCFLDHHKGNSSMCRQGENRTPSFEEMKYICYEKQIQDQLIIAWRSLYSGIPPIVINKETRFTFVINENCKAEQIEIIVSSGNRMFDDMVIASVENAVFPPIPKHFGVKKYRPQGGTIVLR